jgi:hypothetical protein
MKKANDMHAKNKQNMPVQRIRKDKKVGKATKIPVQTHTELISAMSRFNDRLKEDHRLGMLLMIDAVSAFKTAGFDRSELMVKHVRKRAGKLEVTEAQWDLFERVKSGKSRIPWVDRVYFTDLP